MTLKNNLNNAKSTDKTLNLEHSLLGGKNVKCLILKTSKIKR